MNKHLSIVSTLALGILATGCGKELSKLNKDEKAVVKKTLNSLQRSYLSMAKATNQNDALGSDAALSRLFAAAELPGSTQADQKAMDMEKMLNQGIADNKCKVKSSKLSGSISGKDCPINLAFGVEAKEGKNSADFKAKLDYTVNDKDFRKLNDIDSAKLNLSLNVSGEKKVEKIHDINMIDMDSKASATASLEGTLHSQKEKDIKIDGSLKAAKESITAKLTFDFEKFTAEFKVEGAPAKEEKSDKKSDKKADKKSDKESAGMTFKYFLNGEELSEKEMREYIQVLPEVNADDKEEKSSASNIAAFMMLN